MGIKTATSLASQLSYTSFQDDSRPASPQPQPPKQVADNLEPLIVHTPTASDKPAPQSPSPKLTGVHLRRDSANSFACGSSLKRVSCSPSSPMASVCEAGRFDHALLRHIEANGDAADVAKLVEGLADDDDLQVLAMSRAICVGDPYMVKALLNHGVTADNAVRACDGAAPVGPMQDILNLIGTRKPSRHAWMLTLHRAAQTCKARPFSDLMQFLRPQQRELTSRWCGMPILHAASQAGSFEVVCELVNNHGLSPFTPWTGSESGELAYATPIDLAVQHNRGIVVKAFVENPRTRTQLGPKALNRYLTHAVEHGALDAARVLMRAGAKASDAQVAVARKRFEDEMAQALQQNLSEQPVKTSVFAKMKTLRLRRAPVTLSWHDLTDGPGVIQVGE